MAETKIEADPKVPIIRLTRDFAATPDIGELGRLGAGTDVDHAFAQHHAALDSVGPEGGGGQAGEDEGQQCESGEHVGTPGCNNHSRLRCAGKAAEAGRAQAAF